MSTPVVHVAGPYVDYVQKCARCCVVLIDNRNVAYPIASGPPGAWSEGDFVRVSGGCSSLSGDTEATCDEPPRAQVIDLMDALRKSLARPPAPDGEGGGGK